jgi:hypothetical protein
VTRRALIAGVLGLPFVPALAWAEDIVDLAWSDLLPEGEVAPPSFLQGLIDHDQAPLMSQQPESTGIRTDWNGKTVRLPGFVVPLDFDGAAVTTFILVPYVGACIHVPPPPANQLVLVNTLTPYENAGLFEAVHVTGTFQVSTMSTQLAEIGYALTADRIEPMT